MPDQTIAIDDLENGLDRKLLLTIRQRFLSLNEQRLARTRAALAERQQHFLALLPLLFHGNHPMLPGYVSQGTPAGIYQFTPSKEDCLLAKQLSRSFNPTKDLRASTPAIDAMFVMGSMGTIAHSDTSDLDIWICHHPALSAEDIAGLRKKCDLLSAWAETTLHLEVHFFLMTENSFKTTEAASLSKENSGSAQHFLLLDEFYRTAIWLAGKVPLWWFVPAARESDYETFTHRLLTHRFLNPADVIDFGNVARIPDNEFVGAGIWHLYKAIEAPYKSVLKLLLLESYASATNEPPLAVEFKHAVYSTKPDADDLDPYVMIYRRIEHYLHSTRQQDRLQLVRRCFYSKVNKPLTHKSPDSWQRRLLKKLVEQWQWQNYQLHLLDTREHWKATEVIGERTLLVGELAQSYRLLSGMSKNSPLQITQEELGILGRKLHAAFERQAGKIEWINPGISQNLHEPLLTIAREADAKPPHWLLFRGNAPSPAKTSTREPVKRSRFLLELILWAYCNELLTTSTRLDITDHNILFSEQQCQQLLAILAQWLPLPYPAPAHDVFRFNAKPERLLLLVNLGTEPLPEHFKKGMQLLTNQQDALGYSGFRANLVSTADIVQLTSWHEVICRHFEQDALINSLLHYLRLQAPSRISPPPVSFCCFSSGLGLLISRRLEALWGSIREIYYGEGFDAHTRFIFEMGDEYLLLEFMQAQPVITRFASVSALLDKLGEAQSHYSRLAIDTYALKHEPVTLLSRILRSDDIYLFYQRLPDAESAVQAVRVFIVDERGSLFVTDMPFYSTSALLRPLQYFIRRSIERQSLDDNLSVHNLARRKLICHEIVFDPLKNHYEAESRFISSEHLDTALIAIQVAAEPDGQGGVFYTIYCNHQEFSSLEYGEKLYQAVASYILRYRINSERYPCFITDLDLSLCRETLAPDSGLQLLHYLRVKNYIESRLNRALASL